MRSRMSNLPAHPDGQPSCQLREPSSAPPPNTQCARCTWLTNAEYTTLSMLTQPCPQPGVDPCRGRPNGHTSDAHTTRMSAARPPPAGRRVPQGCTACGRGTPITSARHACVRARSHTRAHTHGHACVVMLCIVTMACISRNRRRPAIRSAVLQRGARPWRRRPERSLPRHLAWCCQHLVHQGRS